MRTTNYKIGDTIKVIRMDDANGTDILAQRMAGVVSTIEHIDGMGQLHLKGYPLAVIPEVDEFEVINQTGA